MVDAFIARIPALSLPGMFRKVYFTENYPVVDK
jgi:hypothetical protein